MANDSDVGAFLFFFLLAFWGGIFALYSSRKKRARASTDQAVTEAKRLIAHHARTLATRKEQLTHVDAYGVLETRRWDKEKERFFENLLRPVLAGHRIPATDFIKLQFELIPRWIDEAADEFRASAQHNTSPLSKSTDDMSPLQYERHCAALLNELNWTARLTKGSGDQGADIIAEKDGVRVVVQCKKYTKPVGNKAVQEALAAMKFEDTDFAAVVSNAGFTTAAKELAHKGGVALLRHTELDKLETITQQPQQSRRD